MNRTSASPLHTSRLLRAPRDLFQHLRDRDLLTQQAKVQGRQVVLARGERYAGSGRGDYFFQRLDRFSVAHDLFLFTGPADVGRLTGFEIGVEVSVFVPQREHLAK